MSAAHPRRTASPCPPPRNAVALVAGIGAYPDDSGIPRLKYAAADARALAELLTDPEVCNFPADKVAVLLDEEVRRADLISRLSRWLPQKGRGVELAVIYFAGHGVRHGDEGYLLPHDADPDEVETHGVSMSALARWIERIEAGAVVGCRGISRRSR